MAVEALACLQVARVARHIGVLAGHGVVDLERLLEAREGQRQSTADRRDPEKRRTRKHLEP